MQWMPEGRKAVSQCQQSLSAEGGGGAWEDDGKQTLSLSQRASSPNTRTKVWVGRIIRSQSLRPEDRRAGGKWLEEQFGAASGCCPQGASPCWVPHTSLLLSCLHKGEQFHPPASCPNQKPGSHVKNPSLSLTLDICYKSMSTGWEIWGGVGKTSFGFHLRVLFTERQQQQQNIQSKKYYFSPLNLKMLG